MKILVTGGAGFIGSHFVRSALNGSYASLATAEVVVVDKLTYAGNLANLDPVRANPRLTFVEADILEARLVDSLVGEADAVLNFAAESHVDRSILGASAFIMTNVMGTHRLLEAAARHRLDGLSRLHRSE